MSKKPHKNKPKRLSKSEQPNNRFRLFGLLACVAALLIASGALLVTSPVGKSDVMLDVKVSTGLSARAIAEDLKIQGLEIEPWVFLLTARLTGQASALKAGRYEINGSMSTLDVINLLAKGKGVMLSVSLIEGQTAYESLKKLRQINDLKDDLLNLSEDEIARKLGIREGALEGWLFPDTYRFAPGSTLSHLLERSVRLQRAELEKAWAMRSPGLPLKSPYEALILASIIEKETGKAADRPNISSVFINRLKVGMLLQTDPTVIYGIGPTFNGNLTRADLQTDTAYNTYTRPGLPPTPIANPGRASLYAAVRPNPSPYYYFVAKGDGGSHFSRDLQEHNQAVRRYQLSR